MNGKKTCAVLKDIRRKIAAENDIDFHTEECTFQGECKGTCPRCEAEVRYLESALAKRQKAGKAVALAGVAATLMMTATGCGGTTAPTAETPTTTAAPTTTTSTAPTTTTTELPIDIVNPPTLPPISSEDPNDTVIYGAIPDDPEVFSDPGMLNGDIAYDPYVLDGMVAYEPDLPVTIPQVDLVEPVDDDIEAEINE